MTNDLKFKINFKKYLTEFGLEEKMPSKNSGKPDSDNLSNHNPPDKASKRSNSQLSKEKQRLPMTTSFPKFDTEKGAMIKLSFNRPKSSNMMESL